MQRCKVQCQRSSARAMQHTYCALSGSSSPCTVVNNRVHMTLHDAMRPLSAPCLAYWPEGGATANCRSPRALLKGLVTGSNGTTACARYDPGLLGTSTACPRPRVGRHPSMPCSRVRGGGTVVAGHTSEPCQRAAWWSLSAGRTRSLLKESVHGLLRCRRRSQVATRQGWT